MTKIIDVSQNGGELIILGKSLVVPSDASVGEEATKGAIRFNPVSGSIEFYNGSWFDIGGEGSSGVANIFTGELPISQVLGLQSALTNKASIVHNHGISDINGLAAELSSKAESSHNHTIDDIISLLPTLTAMNTTIAGKASSIHAHSLADITGLQDHIDSLASSSGSTLIGHSSYGTVKNALDAIPSQISTMVLGASYYDVQLHHGLDGTAGDAAKIQAAHNNAPVGSTLVFPAISCLITTTLNFTRNLSYIFNGTEFRFALADDNTDGINYSPMPNDGFDGSSQKVFSGLRYFFTGAGRHGINITTTGLNAVAKHNIFSNIVGYCGPNPAGYAIRAYGSGPHKNIFENCYLGPRGFYDESGDGNQFINCGFHGLVGIALRKMSGAYKTRILGCSFAMGGIAILNLQGEAIDIEGCNFKHVSAFVIPKMPYNGTSDCNIASSIAFLNIYQDGMRGNRIIGNHFDGGPYISNSIWLSGATPSLSVNNTIIDENVFNVCKPLSNPNDIESGIISSDLNIINDNVKFTRFGERNVVRGDRTSLPDTNNAPFYIGNNGLGTYGVWNLFPSLNLQNGWTAGSVFAWRKNNAGVIEFRGSLVAGVKDIDAHIGTMPEWARPYTDTHYMSAGAATGVISTFVIKANGEIRVGPVAFAAAETVLQMGGVTYSAIAQSNSAIGV